MATPTTWNSGGSTDANLAGNYTAGLPADAVITLDATSVVNWILTANLNVDSVTITAAYSGNWSAAGFTMTMNFGFSHDGTGTSDFGNGLTANGGASTVHIGAGVGAVTVTNCILTMNGAVGMTLDLDTAIYFWKTFVLGANAKVTSSGAANGPYVQSAGTAITMGANALFTSNKETQFFRTTDGAVASFGAGAAINGTGIIYWQPYGANVDSTMPAYTYTGSGEQRFNHGDAGTSNKSITFTGTINVGTAALYIYSSAGIVFTANLNGQTFTCGEFVCGHGNAAGSGTFNFGASTINCTSSDGSTYNTGTTNLNLQTATINCSGNWTYGSNHTVTPGTSVVNITGTSTVTSNGKSFYDLTFTPGAANTVTLADALTLTGDWTITNGGLATGNFAITVTQNITLSGAGTLNFGTSTVTSTGNAVITFNAGPTYTTGNSIWIVQGNTAITLNANVTVSRLQTNTAGQTITWTTGANALTINAYVAGDIGLAAGADVIYVSGVPGVQYNINWPAGVNVVQNMNPTDNDASGGGAMSALDGTSVDGGNNVNWLFTVVGVAAIGRPAIGIGLGIGIGI